MTADNTKNSELINQNQ